MSQNEHKNRIIISLYVNKTHNTTESSLFLYTCENIKIKSCFHQIHSENIILLYVPTQQNVMIKNVEGVASKGHVEGDPSTKDNMHNSVRRSNRMRNVPARFRN